MSYRFESHLPDFYFFVVVIGVVRLVFCLLVLSPCIYLFFRIKTLALYLCVVYLSRVV